MHVSISSKARIAHLIIAVCIASKTAAGLAAGGVVIAASVQAFVNWWKASSQAQKLGKLRELLNETERKQVEAVKMRQELIEDIILLENARKEIDDMIESETNRFGFGRGLGVGVAATGLVLGSMYILRSHL